MNCRSNQTKFKKGDLIECISSLGRIGWGEKFTVVDSRPQLSAPSFHPELVYIEVDGVVRNYSPKHFKLVEEKEVENMSRDNIVNKAGSSSGDPPKEKREFQSGDKVRIIKNETAHKYAIGDITYLLSKSRADEMGQWGTNRFDPEGEPESQRYVRMTEIELVKEKPQKIPDGYTWNSIATHTYQDYISVGWTDKQLIENGLLVPVGVSGKPKHTAYVKFPDYHKTYAYILPDSIYEKIRRYKDVKLHVAVNNQHRPNGTEIKVVHLVDVKVNYVDPVATKEIVGVESAFNPQVVESFNSKYKDIDLELNSHVHRSIIPVGQTGMKSAPLEEIYKEWKSKQPNQFLNNKEETNMSNVTNRKTVTVNLIDRDSALDEKYSLVSSFGDFTTSKNQEALIRSIIMNPENKVAELIAQHNEIRSKQVNKEILNRTGNKVFLEPVEESDLYWEIQ